MTGVRKAFDRPGLPRRGRRRARSAWGFTMLEILTVIGILAVLAAMVLLGMRHITGKSKDQETRLTLQNLRNMLAEFDNVTRLGKGPQAWGWNNGSRLTVTVPIPPTPPPAPFNVDMFPNFWTLPYVSTQEAPATGTNAPAPLDAPGSAEGPDSTGRNGARQLMSTQLAMNYLLSVPANRKAMENMRADRLFAPKWVTGDMPAPGPDGVLGTMDDTTERVHYYRGCRVFHDKAYWRFTAVDGASSSPPPSGDWDPEGQETSGPKSLPAPILLDGWNNPILLVPASGLRVRMLNGLSKNDPTEPGQTFVVVSPEGTAKPPVIPGTWGKLVRPGKPFFVSAGPDGDYSTGDDNIYSFEE